MKNGKSGKIIASLLLASVLTVSLPSCTQQSVSDTETEQVTEEAADTVATEDEAVTEQQTDSEDTVIEAVSLSSGWALQDSENYYGDIFGDNEITSVYVELTEEDWNDLCDNATNETYYSANITVNGVSLENVGFRAKGFSSLAMVTNSDSDRYGFKVKTDEFVDGQTLDGLDMFVLNSSFCDASYMREYLTYAACEYLGMATPFVTYTNLYINGELFGFYIMIEAYDDSFVERNTTDENAVLYKADSESCTLGSNDNANGFDVKVGDDAEKTNIIALIETLNTGDASAIEEILDVDSVLKGMAVNTVMGNYDSYSGSKAHNYYLLYENGKFTYIGWDYNMSIGGFSEDNGSSVTVSISSPFYNTTAENRPLFAKLLENEEYYNRYIGYVESLCSYFSDIEGAVDFISSNISQYVQADPTAFYDYDEYLANITAGDTDLSQSSGGIGTGVIPTMPDGETMQIPDDFDPSQFGTGDVPTMPDGETMQVPDDFDPNQQGGGETQPTMPDGETMQVPDDLDPSQQGGGETQPTMPDGETMQIPDGFDPSQFGTGDIPTMPDDLDLSQIGDIDIPGGMENIGDAMMATTTCSIVDYITQRIANINEQLAQSD